MDQAWSVEELAQVSSACRKMVTHGVIWGGRREEEHTQAQGGLRSLAGGEGAGKAL